MGHGDAKNEIIRDCGLAVFEKTNQEKKLEERIKNKTHVWREAHSLELINSCTITNL